MIAAPFSRASGSLRTPCDEVSDVSAQIGPCVVSLNQVDCGVHASVTDERQFVVQPENVLLAYWVKYSRQLWREGKVNQESRMILLLGSEK